MGVAGIGTDGVDKRNIFKMHIELYRFKGTIAKTLSDPQIHFSL